MIGALFSCLIWAAYSLSAWALGARILRIYYPRFYNDILLNPALGTLLGLGIFGTIWSVIALVEGGLQPLTIAPILMFSLFIGWRDIFNYLAPLNPKNFIPKSAHLKWVAIPVLLYLLMAPVMTWHQPGTDALAFYFAQAKLIAYRQGFVPLPGYEAFSQIALPAEFTYAALLTIGPELGARMITVTLLWSAVLVLIALVRDCGAKLIGQWLALVLLLSSTAVTLLISDGKTDLYGGFLALAALYLFVFSPDLSRRHLILMGLMSGFAVMAKLTLLPVLVPMFGLLLLWRFWQQENFIKALGHTISAGLIVSSMVALNFLPLIAKNYLFYAEPLAPFYLFNSANDIGLMGQEWFNAKNTAWILSTYPLVWTFGQYPMQHGIFSPLLWASIPALFFVSWKTISWRNDHSVALAMSGLVALILWAIFFPSIIAPRYIFPIFFAFIPLGAKALEFLWNAFDAKQLKKFVYISIIFIFASVPVYYGLAQVKHGLRMALRGPTKSGISYVYAGLQTGESALHDKDRLLLLGWERSPLQGKSLSCMGSYLDIDMTLINSNAQSGLRFWPDFREAGFKSIVVNTTAGGMEEISQNLEKSKKPTWLKLKTTKVNDFYTIHEMIVDEDKAPAVKKYCASNEHGIWKVTDLNPNENLQGSTNDKTGN